MLTYKIGVKNYELFLKINYYNIWMYLCMYVCMYMRIFMYTPAIIRSPEILQTTLYICARILYHSWKNIPLRCNGPWQAVYNNNYCTFRPANRPWLNTFACFLRISFIFSSFYFLCVRVCVCLPVVVFVLMTSFAHIFGSRVPPFAADLSTINFRQNHTAINLSWRGCVILWQHSIRRPGVDESRACVRMCTHIKPLYTYENIYNDNI